MADSITLIVHSCEVLSNDKFLNNTFISFLSNTKNKNQDILFDDEAEKMEYMENSLRSVSDEPIEYEKILNELGPYITNNMLPVRSGIIDYNLNEKRLAKFILFLCKNQTWNEDKENRQLNKIFLKSLNKDLSINIDENNDKKNVISWNVENFYNTMKDKIEKMNVRN